jgi:hypothetical protein
MRKPWAKIPRNRKRDRRTARETTGTALAVILSIDSAAVTTVHDAVVGMFVHGAARADPNTGRKIYAVS